MLRLAEARWEARGFGNYAVEMQRACFCPPVVAQWSRVEVVDDRVARVVTLATGEEVPEAERGLFPTVEEIFQLIRATSSDDWIRDIDVVFDARLGFPTTVNLISKPEIQDAGGGFDLRNAVPLP